MGADFAVGVTPLDAPLALAGAPIADLIAATTGSDGDFVVKLIDVYPDEYFPKPELGGYQLPIAMDILRGRYRESFSEAKPITPNAPLEYRRPPPLLGEHTDEILRVMGWDAAKP